MPFRISQTYLKKKSVAQPLPNTLTSDEFGLSSEDYLLFDIGESVKSGSAAAAAAPPRVIHRGNCIRPVKIAESDSY